MSNNANVSNEETLIDPTPEQAAAQKASAISNANEIMKRCDSFALVGIDMKEGREETSAIIDNKTRIRLACAILRIAIKVKDEGKI